MSDPPGTNWPPRFDDAAFVGAAERKDLVLLPRPALTVSRTLFACQLCRYWLRPDDDFCPDCGARSLHPAARWRIPVRRWWRRAGAYAGAAVGVATLAVGVPVAVGLLFLAPGATLAGMYLGNERAKSRMSSHHGMQRSAISMQREERKLAAMMATCDEFLARIEHSRKNVERVTPAGPERAAALHALEQGRAARQAQRDECAVRLWWVSFVRWWNGLAPILEGLDGISFEEGDRRIAATEQLQAFAESILEQWRASPVATSRNGVRFLAVFAEALGALERVRVEVALRQARLADPAVSYLDEIPRPGVALARELARFRSLGAEIAAGRYSQAFDELEAQQNRLAAESELAKEFLSGDDD